MSKISTKTGPQFELRPNLAPRLAAARQAGLGSAPFGSVFTDHMVAIDWTQAGGWSGHRVEPYGPLNLPPAAAVLHYAQEIFEGLRAYRWADGSIRAFRPWANAERFARSARRYALPELPLDDFVGSLEALMQVDDGWVPSEDDMSLYVRPFMFASEAFVGVRPARQVSFLVIASPVGRYFTGGPAPVAIWVDTEHSRAAPGGTGAAKGGGNYAGSLLSQVQAYEHGCQQVLFLDAATSTHLEELGGMNVFVVTADGEALTPPTGGTILEGVTRASVMQLVRDRGQSVVERPIALSWLLDALASGEVTEVFACGTAAVITPVGRLVGNGFDVTVADGAAGALTMSLLDELTGIQFGRLADKHGWTHRLA
ncbi:MAG: branched-chain amino acid aminotransferase [Micrococcales bacterium]|nr:branched-chain amino acid aminotransferase [Micrococcales bacterium]